MAETAHINIIIVKPWPNGLASRRKSTKPELANGLTKGGQTDSQVGPQVAESRTFHVYNSRLRAINLSRLALGGHTVKTLRLLTSKFEVDPSQRKSSQVDASRRKWVAKRNARSTQVQNLRRLASPFG